MQQPQREIKAEDLTTVEAGGFSAVVDAYARDAKTGGLWFISMMGNQTSVKAITAVIMGQPLRTFHLIQEHPFDPTKDEYIPCTVPPQTTRTWTRKILKLPSTQAFHALVYSKKAEYTNHSKDFLLLPHTEEQAPHLHYMYLERRINLPLHESWAQWLWDQGIANETILPIQSKGILAYACNPDEELLTEDVSEAISQRVLTIQENSQRDGHPTPAGGRGTRRPQHPAAPQPGNRPKDLTPALST